MNPREIIARAWTITTTVRVLRRWGYVSTVLETLLEAKLVIYQAHFAYTYFVLGEPAGFFEVEEILYHALPFWAFLTFVITLGLAILIEFFLPKVCLGAIIGLAAKHARGEKVRGGLALAIYNFWRIFAIHEMFFLTKLTTATTVISIILRYVGGGFLNPGIIFVIIVWAFSNVLKFFASFGEEAVVIRKLGIFSAVGQSFKIVISYLKDIVFLLLLLVIISLRVFINIIVVLLVPGAAIGAGVGLSFFLPTAVSYTIAAFAGLGLILFLSYLLAYLHVFKQTVWTLTYLELSSRKRLDIIEEPEPEAVQVIKVQREEAKDAEEAEDEEDSGKNEFLELK